MINLIIKIAVYNNKLEKISDIFPSLLFVTICLSVIWEEIEKYSQKTLEKCLECKDLFSTFASAFRGECFFCYGICFIFVFLFFGIKIFLKSFAVLKKGITFAVLFGQKFFDTREANRSLI